MKNLILTGILLISVVLGSCEKQAQGRIGFNSSVNPDSRGLSILHVNNTVEYIYLEGIFILEEGEAEIKLLNPQGYTVIFRHIKAPASFKINEVIEAVPGFWKLKYTSDRGYGKIDLHLNYY
jgi:hypothetical protein